MLTRGLSGAGNSDSSTPPTSTAVGRNTPANPSWSGWASGTLTTPWEVRPEVFTAMNGTGWSLFGTRRDEASQKQFLDFRAELARRMEEEWLGVLESLRREKPDLDLVLTHVDDRFDTGMREAIGADAARVLPMLDTHSFTFLIEDPEIG